MRAGAAHLGDAEVEDLDHLVVVEAREEHVPRLEIAVDDAGLVGAAQRLGATA